MKLNKNILILLSLILTSCVNIDTSISTSQIEKPSSFLSDSYYYEKTHWEEYWNEVGFEDVEIPTPKFQWTFNEKVIPFKYETYNTMLTNNGCIMQSQFYDFYSDLKEEYSYTNFNIEYLNQNVLKFESSLDFYSIDAVSLFKINQNGQEEKSVNIDFTNSNNLLIYNINKEENCAGYIIRISVPYIVKDIRGYMFEINALILF